jgi:parallel beta-helix repeat protein
MLKRSDSRGLSTIVATLLIILLVLVAVAFLWAVVRGVIKGNAEQVSLGKFTLDLKIKNVVRDVNENSMDVKMKRNPGKGQFSGLAFIVEDEENSEVFDILNSSLYELEERTFNITLSSAMNVSELKKLSVAPIFTLKSGKEVIGEIADVYFFPPNIETNLGTNETNETNCTDNCSSLGYECEIQTVCETSVNCGSCSGGDICSGGICVQCIGVGCIESCGTLSNAGTTYTLTSDVNSTGTCFNITAPNIILDCKNREIIYSTGGAASTYGIYSNQFNTTIKNCNVLDGNWISSQMSRPGIFFNANDNSTLYNNFINTSNSYAIELFNAANFNNLTSNRATTNSSQGIYLQSSSNNTLTNNIGTSNSSHGIYLSSADNNTLINNIGTSNGNGIGIYLNLASKNILTGNIATSNTSFGISLATSSKNNILTNNKGTSNSSHGIYFVASSNNNILTNNIGTSNIGSGILLTSSSNNNILTNNIGISNSSNGIYLSSADNNTLINNIGTSNTSNGIRVESSSNNTFINQIARILGTTGTISYGVYIQMSNNIIFRDCINISGATKDVYYASGAGSINNTFINCSYDTSKELVQGTGNELIRKWYYQAQVNYLNGSAASGADISAYNNLDILQFTALTDSLGQISRQEVIDYINIGGAKNYYSMYTINASKAGYTTDTNTFNFTIQQNKMDDLFNF